MELDRSACRSVDHISCFHSPNCPLLNSPRMSWLRSFGFNIGYSRFLLPESVQSARLGYMKRNWTRFLLLHVLCSDSASIWFRLFTIFEIERYYLVANLGTTFLCEIHEIHGPKTYFQRTPQRLVRRRLLICVFNKLKSRSRFAGLAMNGVYLLFARFGLRYICMYVSCRCTCTCRSSPRLSRKWTLEAQEQSQSLPRLSKTEWTQKNCGLPGPGTTRVCLLIFVGMSRQPQSRWCCLPATSLGIPWDIRVVLYIIYTNIERFPRAQ